jgi:hypothetical protein
LVGYHITSTSDGETNMRKLLVRALLAIVAATSGVAIAEAAAPDPVIGTWQLNVSKSTFTPGPAPKSETRTYSLHR